MCVGHCQTRPMQNIDSRQMFVNLCETGRHFGVFVFHNGVIVVGVFCAPATGNSGEALISALRPYANH